MHIIVILWHCRQIKNSVIVSHNVFIYIFLLYTILNISKQVTNHLNQNHTYLTSAPTLNKYSKPNPPPPPKNLRKTSLNPLQRPHTPIHRYLQSSSTHLPPPPQPTTSSAHSASLDKLAIRPAPGGRSKKARAGAKKDAPEIRKIS